MFTLDLFLYIVTVKFSVLIFCQEKSLPFEGGKKSVTFFPAKRQFAVNNVNEKNKKYFSYLKGRNFRENKLSRLQKQLPCFYENFDKFGKICNFTGTIVRGLVNFKCFAE